MALDIKLFAARCAVTLAEWCTLPMVQDGSTIYFGRDSLLIGEVCGGLRSLIALLAFGSVFAYISQTKPWARWSLLVLAAPIAVVTNVLRIFFLCVVGYFWGSQTAAGIVHDISGYGIFGMAFVAYFLLEMQLRRWAPADAPSGDGS